MNLEGRTVRAENGIEKATNTGIVLRLFVFLKLGGSETCCSSSEIGCIIRLKQLGQSDLTEAPMLK